MSIALIRRLVSGLFLLGHLSVWGALVAMLGGFGVVWGGKLGWFGLFSVALLVGALISWRRLKGLFVDERRSAAERVWLQLSFAHLFASLLVLPGGALLAVIFLFGNIAVYWAPIIAYGLGVGVALYGAFIRRRWVVTRRETVLLDALPEALEGLRIAHLSDLHIGGLDTVTEGKRWVRQVHDAQPDLILVTGDLVTSGTQFYPDAAEVLSELRAPLGAYVILGNHDQWDSAAFKRVLAERGVKVLDNEWVVVKSYPTDMEPSHQSLVVAGLGDPYTRRADLELTLAGRPPGLTLLMAHYPTWAKRALGKDVALVLSGHTHGGQLGLPWLSEWLNFARLTKQYSRGLFNLGGTQLYVSSGLGTTGLPIRFGVAPEIALLTLSASKRSS